MKVTLFYLAILCAPIVCAAAIVRYVMRRRRIRMSAPVALDLFGAERPTFTLRMPRTGRVLHLLVLSKRDCERVLTITDRAKTSKTLTDNEYLSLLTEAAAIILSCNAEGRQFDTRRVSKMLAYDDIATIVTRYLDWLSGLATAKN